MKLTPYQKKELRTLLHDVCVARDGHKCLRCGKTTTLAASHIYPKGTYRRMEYDYDNVKTLCVSCHIYWWHKNPIEANTWLQENINPIRLKRLKLRSLTIEKGKIDYKLIKIELKIKLKEYNQ